MRAAKERNICLNIGLGNQRPVKTETNRFNQSFLFVKKKLPARHKDFPANSVSTWPLYDSMNLGGIQSSAMARAIKLPKMVGASGVSRTKSSRFFIKKSNAERKNNQRNMFKITNLIHFLHRTCSEKNCNF